VRPLFLFAVLAGCSYPSFGFEASDAAPSDTSTEDSRLDDTAVADAVEETTVDTALDTNTGEVLATDTGMPDIGKESGPLGYCASSSHAFCNDFDSSTEPTYGWNGNYLDGGGTFTVGTPAFSAPRSLSAQFPAGSTASAALLTRNLDAPTADALTRIEFRARFSAATFPKVLLLRLQRDTHGASLWLGSSGLYISAYGATFNSYDIGKTIVPDTWYRFRVDLSLKISGARVRVYIDDMTTPLVDHTDASLAVAPEGTARDLALGVYTDEPTFPALAVRYDDVSVDWL
jgi:hypothetical protein